MNMHNTLARIALALVATAPFISSPAHAAGWAVEGRISAVQVKDKANDGGTADTHLSITLADGGGKYCNGTIAAGGIVTIARTESVEFDNWVKLAQAALLSGRPLRIGSFTPNSVANCKPSYLQLK